MDTCLTGPRAFLTCKCCDCTKDRAEIYKSAHMALLSSDKRWELTKRQHSGHVGLLFTAHWIRFHLEEAPALEMCCYSVILLCYFCGFQNANMNSSSLSVVPLCFEVYEKENRGYRYWTRYGNFLIEEHNLTCVMRLGFVNHWLSIIKRHTVIIIVSFLINYPFKFKYLSYSLFTSILHSPLKN